jgi:hypothetical protein
MPKSLSMVAVAEEEDLPHDLMDARVGKRPLFPRDTIGWLLVWFNGGFCIFKKTHNYSSRCKTKS